MNKSLIPLAISLALAAGAAHAGHRQSFSVERTRTTSQGTFTRHTEQTATADGFTRSSTVTNPQGQTATHSVGVVNDASTGTHTREMSGTRFNGNTYSGQSVTQRTADGYTRSGEVTGANGQTASRDAVTTVDKENKTLSREITKTGPNGQTSTSTVTKTYTGGTE